MLMQLLSGGVPRSAMPSRSRAASALVMDWRLAATHPVSRWPTFVLVPRSAAAAGPNASATVSRVFPESSRYHAPVTSGTMPVISVDESASRSATVPSPAAIRARLTNASSSSDATACAEAEASRSPPGSDRHDRIRKIDQRQDVGANVDVKLHLLEFRIGQLARLVQDVLGYRELAGIVQQRRRLDRFDRFRIIDAKRIRQRDGVRLYSSNVAVRDVVFGIYSHRQRFDGGEIEPIQIDKVPLSIFETSERCAQREVEHGNQREDHDRGCETHLLDEQDEAECGRCRREVSDRQPHEMSRPEVDDRFSGVERYRSSR